MKRIFRVTPHKVKKQNKKHTESEIREIRAENQKLKRENSRLRKELQKNQHLIPENEEVKSLGENKENNCPKCDENGTLTRLDLGVKVLVVCKKCKFRKAL